ncbi:hypothetical protein FRC01_009761 [Tulasnella sp. 417]|nr:hypothetical protein FRC01_009761 [Tulasnella sp. 417]
MSCLSGKALRWAMQLDRNTRRDWDLLSTALLLEYTGDVEDNGTELRSPAIPTPAAASAAPTELVRATSTLSLGPLSGRIRVETDLSSIRGYVSRDGNSSGVLTICSDAENALRVHWTPSSSPHLIHILGHVESIRNDPEAGESAGKSRAAVWNVLADSTIIPIVEESGYRYSLIPFVWEINRVIAVVANCEAYMKQARFNGLGLKGGQVKLVFEPF